MDDVKEFEEVQQAFKDLDFASHEVEGLYAIVAGVLAVGNVTFKSAPEDSSKVDPKAKQWVQRAADIFQVKSQFEFSGYTTLNRSHTKHNMFL